MKPLARRSPVGSPVLHGQHDARLTRIVSVVGQSRNPTTAKCRCVSMGSIEPLLRRPFPRPVTGNPMASLPCAPGAVRDELGNEEAFPRTALSCKFDQAVVYL